MTPAERRRVARVLRESCAGRGIEMTEAEPSTPNEVPLVERLRSIPVDAHLSVHTPNPLGHDTRHWAVGALCHDAAAQLDALRAELEAARDAANRIEGDDVLARLRSGNATPEDQYNVANSLAYLWAQDGLLSEAQQEVGQLRDQLAEVERPLDKQMARLNANLLAANRARMDAERELYAARADAERLAYWFGNKPKPLSLVDDYLEGIRERWSLDLWRAAIDAARKA